MGLLFEFILGDFKFMLLLSKEKTIFNSVYVSFSFLFFCVFVVVFVCLLFLFPCSLVSSC